MLLKKIHEGVALICNSELGLLATKKSGGLYGILKNNELKQLLEGDIDRIKVFYKKIFYTTFNQTNQIFIYDLNKPEVFLEDPDHGLTISSGTLTKSELVIFYTERDDFVPIGMYLIDSDFQIKKSKPIKRYTLKVDENYFNYLPSKLFCYNSEHQLIYTIELSNHGRNLSRHRDTGEILTDKPNEIYGDIFSYQNFVYVPLKGGQLLALNASDGSKAWFWEHDSTGSFKIIEDKIYKHDGKGVHEIDALSGKLLRSKKYDEEKHLKGLHTAGPFWLYPDVIITVDVKDGVICMLDRKTLKCSEFFSINMSITHSNTSLVWDENKLYVLDIFNNLHIYGKE